MPSCLPGTIRLFDANYDIQPLGMIVLRDPDRPGDGLLLVRGRMQTDAVVILDPPAVLVSPNMILRAVSCSTLAVHPRPTRESVCAIPKGRGAL